MKRIFLVLTAIVLGACAPAADTPEARPKPAPPTTLAVSPLEALSSESLGPTVQRHRDDVARWESALRAAETKPKAKPAPTTTIAAAAAPAPPGSNYQRFVRLADCESGERWYDDQGHVHFVEGSANWALNTGNGYYGGLQFSAQTWHQAGGTGLPHEHPMDVQISIAESWLAKTSWAQWPDCSRDLGYR